MKNKRYQITKTFPREYSPIFKRLFDNFLNLESSKPLPCLEKDYIENFLKIFNDKLAASFIESKQYLVDLNKYFDSSSNNTAKLNN